jgi:hypothetical protein
MDRIVLGEHANTDLGVGLYVSKPGSNVMDPEIAVSGNLMFNSNEGSSLNIIQSGTFKITCDRISIPSAPSISISNTDNFWKALQSIGYSIDDITSRKENILEKGTMQIPITSPLPNGEIPEVALRFAVGNSSGHFHPWYANVTTSGSGMNWDEFSYANSAQIVHMDSPWIRMKWGGIGNESYSGAHLEHTKENFLKLLDDGVFTLDEMGSLLGLGTGITREDVENAPSLQEDYLKQFTKFDANAQGAVGLVQYCNSTSLTVDAYMSPTHAGRRAYGRGEYHQDSMSDFLNWNFPLEDGGETLYTDSGTPYQEHEPIIHASYGDYWDYQWSYPPQVSTSSPFYDFSYGYDSRPVLRPDGRAARYVHNAGVGRGGMPNGDDRPDDIWAFEYPTGPASLLTVLPGRNSSGIGPYPNSYSYDDIDWADYAEFDHNLEYSPYGPEGYRVSRIPFDHLPMVDTFLSPMEQLVEARKSPYYTWSTLWDFSGSGGYHSLSQSDNPFISSQGGLGHIQLGLQTLGRGYGRKAKDDGNQDIYGWNAHPTQFFVNPYSNNQVTFGGLYKDDISYEYKTAALGGAGTGDDDAWDTFYCSYAVYSVGGELPVHSAQTPNTVVIDMRSTEFGGHLQATGKFFNDPMNSMRRYYNLSFPEDFVETIGDSATDPFSDVRDYTDAQNRIYGNVNVIFKIPFLNENVVGGQNYVHVGSKNMSYATVSVGGELVEGPVGVPDPAITFDLSDKYFIFENNKGMTLTIENSGYVMGGGGSGGRGERRGNIKQSGQSYMGGGGGAGSGSGGFEDEAEGEAYGGSVMSHNGPGIGGTGFGQGSAFDDSSDLVASEAQRGINGTSIISELYISQSDPTAAVYSPVPAGGSAATVLSQVQGLYTLTEPVEGGNGGDAFKVLTGTYLPTIEIINKPNSFILATSDGFGVFLSYPGGVIVSGGGGGGGGVGKVPFDTSVPNDPANASGASGAKPGYNANEIQGSPDNIFNFLAEVTQNQGGLAGYIVSGNGGGAYNGRVSIRNEAGSSGSTIRGRHPTSTTRGYVAGFEVSPDETKVYK